MPWIDETGQEHPLGIDKFDMSVVIHHINKCPICAERFPHLIWKDKS